MNSPRRVFQTDPTDPNIVVEAVVEEDGTVSETITHDATKPGPGLQLTAEGRDAADPREQVAWPAVAAYASLALSIGHILFSALR